MACPGCGSLKNKPRPELGAQIYECRSCGAVHGTCYLGDSYGIVKPFLSAAPVPAEQLRYFDFITLGSAGVGRRHGWFDPATRNLVQIG